MIIVATMEPGLMSMLTTAGLSAAVVRASTSINRPCLNEPVPSVLSLPARSARSPANVTTRTGIEPAAVGSNVGGVVGAWVGAAVGNGVGARVGGGVNGAAVGPRVGVAIGAAVGEQVMPQHAPAQCVTARPELQHCPWDRTDAQNAAGTAPLSPVHVGAVVGLVDGPAVGLRDGAELAGPAVGPVVGLRAGAAVGAVGAVVGTGVGSAVGRGDGRAVGTGVAGAGVGVAVGPGVVGATVGLQVASCSPQHSPAQSRRNAGRQQNPNTRTSEQNRSGPTLAAAQDGAFDGGAVWSSAGLKVGPGVGDGVGLGVGHGDIVCGTGFGDGDGLGVGLIVGRGDGASEVAGPGIATSGAGVAIAGCGVSVWDRISICPPAAAKKHCNVTSTTSAPLALAGLPRTAVQPPRWWTR